jgi:cytidylate kinase
VAQQVVTISASFGAGGSVIGPAVADRLGVPFVDRAIPAAVAHDLSVPIDRAVDHDQQLKAGFSRMLSKMANSMLPYGAMPMGGIAEDDEEVYRATTEKVLHEVAATTGGVILGRAAAVVLAKQPGALHIRLDGPPDRRLARAASHEGAPEDSTERLLQEADRARVAYVKHFYRCDPRDAHLYHLVLDSTAFSTDTSVDLIVAAARGRID